MRTLDNILLGLIVIGMLLSVYAGVMGYPLSWWVLLLTQVAWFCSALSARKG